MKDTKNYLLGTHYRTHRKETLNYHKNRIHLSPVGLGNRSKRSELLKSEA